MAPHLLSVSGAIRNMIYEYVFTEDDGVCYLKDAQGVDHLYLVQESGQDTQANGLAYIDSLSNSDDDTASDEDSDEKCDEDKAI
jgi:hypothetical protein